MGFDDRPDDVLRQLCLFLHSPRDFASLSCVSHGLNDLVAGSLADARLEETMRFPLLTSFEDESQKDARSRCISFLLFKLVSVLDRQEAETALALSVKVIEFHQTGFKNDDAEDLGTCSVSDLILKRTGVHVWQGGRDLVMAIRAGRGDSVTSDVLNLVLERLGVLEWQGGGDLVLALKAGELDAYVAVLLWTLSNLTKLTITLGFRDEWLLWAIGKVVSLDFIPPALSSGFSSLRVVNLKWASSVEDTADPIPFLSFDTILAVISLPAVDEISLTSFVAVSDDRDSRWKGVFGSSTLTRLRLTHCRISLKNFEEMLSIPRALRFLYVDGKFPDDEAAYRPAKLDLDNMTDEVRSRDLTDFILESWDQLLDLAVSKDMHNSFEDVQIGFTT